jgi:SSS family solute:Na+ symporter
VKLELLDIIIFIAYCLVILSIGLFVSRNKKGEKKKASDYFLASRSLPWWVIGASLIASNISAEQFIGMSGSGYVAGMAIATYEWIAAAMLIIVAKYFVPIYLKLKIYTMPEFLEKRYDKRVKIVLAVFWLLLYVFVNLTSVLYLGGLTIKAFLGVDLIYAIALIAFFSIAYSIYGGLQAVAWTDVIQVIFLVLGGLITTFVALNELSGGTGVIDGFMAIVNQVPEKFHMILSPEDPSYQELPGIRTILGGLWVLGFSYWGCSQYITQRALAAKSVNEARKGLLFAGYLKILLPLIVVLPGIAAYALNADITKPDEAYPWLLATFVPVGFKGAALAALFAAIVSSLSSMTNSAATIFTMDIAKEFWKNKINDENAVTVGRISGVVFIVIAVLIAPFLSTLQQVFQFIQEFTGFVSPAIFALFLFGLFWKRATADAVLIASLISIPVSFGLKYLFPLVPFLDRIGIVFIIICILIVSLSLKQKTEKASSGYEKELFITNAGFNVASIGIMAILTALYIIFW